MTLDLFHFQAIAADRMADREAFGLHDEMGVGKTPTTIGAANRVLAERGIVICPAMLRANWLKEFKRFDRQHLKVVRAKNIHDFVAWTKGRFDILVCSYEHATKWAERLHQHGEYLDFIALDEAHYLKNVETARTQAILGDLTGKTDKRGIMQYAAHRWHITGTPATGSPIDYYTFLRMVGAIDLKFPVFADAFFNAQSGAYSIGYTVKETHVELLRQLMQANSIRRTHGDVGLELPPIWLTETVIDGDTTEIEEAVKAYPYLEEQIIAAIEANDISLLNAAHIATVRRLVGKAKGAAYAQLLKMELDSGSSVKRVSFFVHTEPLLFVYNHLIKYGYKPVLVYGDTPESEANRNIELYQNDPTIGPFLCNIRKAGVGLTLTAGAEEDIVESDWVPATNAQAIKRVHRYGQTRGVTARFITLADSIDETVNATVAEKTAEIARVEGFAMTAALPSYGA